MPRILFKVLNFEFIIRNSIVYTSFCVQTSELNDILQFIKTNYFSDIFIGKTGGRLIFGLIRTVIKSTPILRSEVFTATKVNKIFSGYQYYQLAKNYQRFRDHRVPIISI
jgi:hypothetical protein